MKCPECNKGNIEIRLGRHGLFGSCDSYPKCKYALKLHDVIFNILKEEGINIYGWSLECWKCHKETTVHTYFINKQLKPHMGKYAELSTIGLGSIPSIDQYLVKNSSTININFSKTTGCSTASNNCKHCGALIGNYFVVEDPHEIYDDLLFNDLEKYKILAIPFSSVNVSKSEFYGLENRFIQIG